MPRIPSTIPLSLRTVYRLFTLVGLLLVVSLPGCGGGGGGETVRSTPVRLDIAWRARSRAVKSPSSALSAVVTLAGAMPTGNDLIFTVNRNTAPDAYMGSYTSPGTAKVGAWPVTIRFYAQPDGEGALVGVASTQVSLQPDGTGIGEITTEGTIVSVELLGNQWVGAGERKDLLLTARDKDNGIVAVTPGSVFYTVADGTDKLRVAGGQLEGVQEGQAFVTAQIDAASSAPTPVTVLLSVTITPASALVNVGEKQPFTAAVIGSASTGVNWSVQEGAPGGTVDASGQYTAPAHAGTYHLVAASVRNPSRQAVVPVTVQSGDSSVIVR